VPSRSSSSPRKGASPVSPAPPLRGSGTAAAGARRP
jgi:hypothetical protein